jgi:hypothetical protein
MKKIVIVVSTVVIILLIFILIDSVGINNFLALSIIALITFGPLYHAYRAAPERMPNYWMFIVFFTSLFGYALFLFFLFNKDRLGYYQNIE